MVNFSNAVARRKWIHRTFLRLSRNVDVLDDLDRLVINGLLLGRQLAAFTDRFQVGQHTISDVRRFRKNRRHQVHN